MAIGSILNNGVAGIQKGLNNMKKASGEIAQLSVSDDPAADLTKSAVSLLESKVQVEANAKVLETASKTIGSIIDITV